MARFLVSLFLLAVTSPVHAAPFLWLHNSASPVVVPGGTSSFYMDETPPPDLQPAVVEAITVADGATVSFPVFTSVPFVADTGLEPYASASVNLSADQEMTECAAFSQTVVQVNAVGGTTMLGAKSFSGLTIPMSPDSGVTGWTEVGLLMPIDPGVIITTGEGVALTVSITNNCGSSRTLWLAYDSPDAEAFLNFVPTNVVEFKCQTTTSGVAGKFLQTKSKCIAVCQKHVLAGSEPASDCVPPYGGTTATCISKSETRTVAKEAACIDCPECYAGGDCTTDANTRVGAMELAIDAIEAGVFCDDSGSDDGLTALEAKCQQRLSNTLGKLSADEIKCLAKCHAAEFKGRVPAGSCAPPVTDPRTAACLTKIETKAAALIDKTCTVDAPECDVASGSSWVGAVAAAAQSFDGGLFCGSPSGAFVD